MGTVYAKDVSEPESLVDSRGKQIDLTSIPARVEKVNVDGLSRTKDDIVIESVEDLFKSQDFAEVITNANRVREKLESLGCFRNVEIFIDTSREKNATKDSFEVTYFVKEFATGKGTFQTQVGNNETNAAIGVQFPNIFGRGERASIETTLKWKKFNSLNVSFMKPLRTKYNAVFTNSVFQQKSEFPTSGYHLIERGGLFDLAFNISPLLRHNLQYEACWREIRQSSKTDPLVVREEYGHSIKSSLRHIVTLDQRDSPIFSSRGTLIRLTTELAGLGGNIGFLKNELNFQTNVPLAKGFVLQGSFQAGLLTSLFEGKTVTIADKFHLGGPTSVRGFQTRGIIHRPDSQSMGAKVFWASGIHLYTPLPFRPGRGGFGDLFRFHLFTNLGLCEDIVFTENLVDNFNMLFTGYRASYGAGVVLRLGQMGKIELNYVIPLMFKPSDNLNPGVQFGIGLHFL